MLQELVAVLELLPDSGLSGAMALYLSAKEPVNFMTNEKKSQEYQASKCRFDIRLHCQKLQQQWLLCVLAESPCIRLSPSFEHSYDWVRAIKKSCLLLPRWVSREIFGELPCNDLLVVYYRRS
jgi:hypothetical protein